MKLFKYLWPLLLLPQIAFASYAVPLSATTTTGTIFAFPAQINGIAPAFLASFYQATSTIASQFPFASTTALTATSLCFTGDICRTTWPTGGGGGGSGWTFIKGGIYNSTSTDQVMIDETATTSAAKLEVNGTTNLKGTIFQNGLLLGTSTTDIWIDGNRTDSYTADGTLFHPFKTITTADTYVAATAMPAAVYMIAPATYSEQSMTLPSIPLVIHSEGATITLLSGASVGAGTMTIPSDMTFYDAVIFGNVALTASSLTNPHTLVNAFIAGNVTFSGLATMINSATVDQNTTTYPFLSQNASSTLTGNVGSLVNILGSNIQNVITNKGTMNIDDDNVQTSTSTRYSIDSSAAGSILNVSGATIQNYGTGGSILLTNGATTQANNLTAIAATEGAGSTNGIDVGTSATYLSKYTIFTTVGVRIYASGSGLGAPSDAALNVEGNSLLNIQKGLTGIATSTPFWALTVASSSGPQIGLVDTSAADYAWTLRSINNNLYFATSTATATSSTSAFSINSNGLVSFSSLAGGSTLCVHASSLGQLSLAAADCGSGGGGSWPFTITDTNYGVAVQSTTTPEWFKNGLMASSTSYFVNATTSFLTTGTFWNTGITSALASFDANHKENAYAGSAPCTNQVALSLSALGVITCTSISDAMFSGQLSASHGGTNKDLSAASGLLYFTSGVANTVATSSPGIFTGTQTNGFVLGLSGGVPTWVATSSSAVAASDPFTHPAAGQSATTSLMLLNGNASTTLFSVFNTVYVGGTATSTIVGNGATSTLNSTLVVATTSATALNVNDQYGTNVLRLSTASTTAGYDLLELWSATSTGPLFGVDQYGHLFASSTTPVLSSCGTTPSLSSDSSDFSGTITVGSVSATACTLTFGTPHTTGTHCVISNQSMSVVNAMTYTESTTGFTVSMTGLTSDKLDYICTGR